MGAQQKKDATVKASWEVSVGELRQGTWSPLRAKKIRVLGGERAAAGRKGDATIKHGGGGFTGVGRVSRTTPGVVVFSKGYSEFFWDGKRGT